MFDAEKLALDRSIATGIDRVEWAKVLEMVKSQAKFLNLGFNDIEKLVESSATPHQLMVVIRLFYEYSKNQVQEDSAFETLIDLVDESSYSLSDWIEGIELFAHWLAKEGRKTHFKSMLEFLICACEAPDTQSAAFKDVIQDFLEVHGFDEEKYFKTS